MNLRELAKNWIHLVVNDFKTSVEFVKLKRSIRHDGLKHGINGVLDKLYAAHRDWNVH